MFRQIFVNLAVQDVVRARGFFEQLGLSFDPRFSNEQGACLVIAENIYAMLLSTPMFEGFAGKPASPLAQNCEALLALSCDNREEVDAVVARAQAAGARTPRPTQDHGFMYGRSFDDLDGHIWEVFYMDPDYDPSLSATPDAA